jgi:hypothetical protein
VYIAARMRESRNSHESASRPPAGGRLYVVGIVVLTAFHGLLSLQLFGPANAFQRLVNDDPVTSGRHPLFLEQSPSAGSVQPTDCRFDPSSYAGCPRPTLFDPAVPLLGWLRKVTGRTLPPAAYKVALAVTYTLVPAALGLAAFLCGAGRAASLAVAMLAVAGAWFRPAADWIENGDPCIPVVIALASICTALLLRWHRQPSACSWLGGVSCAAVGWTIHPGLWTTFLIVPLVGWAKLVRRHCRWWHASSLAALVFVIAAGFAVCGDRLPTWWENVWGRAPVGGALPHDIAALVLWLCVFPVGQMLGRSACWLVERPYAGFAVGSGVVLGAAGLLVYRPNEARLREWWGPRPLAIGLPSAATSLVALIRERAPDGARVLMEDLSGRPDLAWTALVARRAGPAFVGGRDPDGTLEHSACALRDGALAGKAIGTWTDAELDRYARRYNIGCVVCTTPAVGERIAVWPAATAVEAGGVGNWKVFVLRRPYSFVLKGNAADFQADQRRITIGDVVPEHGEVVLSLHYQPGWRARPAGVRIEPELDPYDPIPLVRLRVPDHVGRVTVTWDGR